MPEGTDIRRHPDEIEEAQWQRRVKRQDFLEYYERELSYLRQLGAEFKKNHPAIASGLRLEKDQCEDPHVERLLEAFAFVAARIHLRIDDEFPEIAGPLIEELYPNFGRPVPSFALVEFQMDPERAKQTVGRKVARHSSLVSNPLGRKDTLGKGQEELEGFVCRFRTCFETDLWPLVVDHASWRTSASSVPPQFLTRPTTAVLQLSISCGPDVDFQDLNLSTLRFHLSGGNDLVFPLYELLLSRAHSILLQGTTRGGEQVEYPLPAGAITAVGFSKEDSLCLAPHDQRTFLGYQLLEDYFAFPEKYLFIDVNGLSAIASRGISKKVTLLFLISPFEKTEWRNTLEQYVKAGTFRLNCTPIVNLFPADCGPISLRANFFEVPVHVDRRNEIFSIDSVDGLNSSAGKLWFERYIDCGGKGEYRTSVAGYWNAVRRPSRSEEGMSELFLSVFSRDGDFSTTGADSLSARLTCTNRDLPSRLPMSQSAGDFYCAEHRHIRIVCLRLPTKGAPAPWSRTSLWRLISQLSLNHLSLVEGGRKAFQCLLSIHNLTGMETGKQNIEGFSSISSSPHFARVSSEHGEVFVRGKRVDIALDEGKFQGRGSFLFGSVLERFLSLYTSLNSFTQLTLTSHSAGEKRQYTWPPRAGNKVMV